MLYRKEVAKRSMKSTLTCTPLCSGPVDTVKDSCGEGTQAVVKLVKDKGRGKDEFKVGPLQRVTSDLQAQQGMVALQRLLTGHTLGLS